MLVKATRRLPDIAVHGLVLLGLFIVVIVLQGALTSAFRALGLNGGLSLAASGLVVLGVVLAAHFWMARSRADREAALEAARAKQGLPDGPCCVVWRAPNGAAEDDGAMPWALEGPIRVGFPKAAQALRVEGMAIVEFEVGADGKAKNLHCVDCWPIQAFYNSAAAALKEAHFVLKPGAAPRFGGSFRMPFVFRIAGAARLREAGRRAKRRRPLAQAAARAIGRLQERAAERA